eukprot:8931090-Pyramimonas_sp.AAC.1
MSITRIKKQLQVISKMPQEKVLSKHVPITSSSMHFEMAGYIYELDEGQLARLVDQTEGHLATASSRSMATARK